MLNRIFRGKRDSSGLDDGRNDRQPCVAGQFYPGTEEQLRANLKSLFADAAGRKRGNPLAIVAPHAGYVFSGQVAASAYNQIDRDAEFERIFMIGSSHRDYFEGASVYNQGDYITPLGRVEVDTRFADELINGNDFFTYRPEADLKEHSLEVQLPFLQYHLRKHFRIVPIIIATQNPELIEKIATALKPYLNPKNLFVISSDFSHYPNYENAIAVDEKTALSIGSNSPEKFLKTIRETERQNIPGLATAICGWTSVLTLLNISSKKDDIEIFPINYKNSGDAYYGEKDRVVGYWAIAFYGNNQDSIQQEVFLTDEEKQQLISIARNSIMAAIWNKDSEKIVHEPVSEGLKLNAGLFVSVYVEDDLRGCIGRFNAADPLWKTVEELAVSAATEDSRFRAIRPDELDSLSVELSVLTPMRKISSIDEIELGRHGIYVKKGMISGTFLPQVALKYNWTTEELLGHCAREKARIGWDGWKSAEIFVYEALIFGDKEV